MQLACTAPSSEHGSCNFIAFEKCRYLYEMVRTFAGHARERKGKAFQVAEGSSLQESGYVSVCCSNWEGEPPGTSFGLL